MKIRLTKIAAVAVIIVTLIGGINFWPKGAGNGKWWLGPPAAWGQEMLAELEKVQCLVYRQKGATIYDYGPTELDTGWERRYCAENAYRRDRYHWRDGKTIANTKWIFPDGNEAEMLEISYEYECYYEQRTNWQPFYEDKMKRLQWYVKLLDRADQVLGTEIFDGRECIGFKVSAAKYGDNPQGRFDRIWFDVETKLPARIEQHGFEGSFHKGYKSTIIHDEFEYYAEVPVELFEPEIPEGFINAHPDEVRAAREREVKGEMVYADVPDGLVDEIVAALRSAQNGFYHSSALNADIYVSKDAWRIDNYSNGEYHSTTWFIVEHPSDTNLLDIEAGSEYMLTKWHSDSEGYVYDAVGYTKKARGYGHPMDHILFKVGLCSRADRFIEDTVIDGVKCFGFEISAKKYGDTVNAIDRLWFDKETKLPVRTEIEMMTDEGPKKNIRDRFEWNSLPPETFEPKIRHGQTFAPVPVGLREQILDALNEVETCSYWQGQQRITFCRTAWREDYYSGDTLTKTVWNVLEEYIPEFGSWRLDKDVTKPTTTIVDFSKRTYEVKKRKDKFWNHLMNNITNLVGFIEAADQFSRNVEIDGVESFGFEISPSKFGSSRNDHVWRFWFDIGTKLPVKIEIEYPSENKTIIQDQFHWDSQLDEEAFVPIIPEGFELIERDGK